ncbi:HPr kinase/phosphorylase [Martelella radicis]|uniref:Serine kinase of HPr protein (Carbohydrate metabolism regulator) n=1 Tax=Martelella radicis TaxID=1397476 RepID=A0A7W6P8C1_9HYPH|nr:HPr kinase/phosphorylase [Martelella radicis]MBB4121102.1 serine kinase of HPr protein (carbohydrate metabolism regulator) [Martelella radicis]
MTDRAGTNRHATAIVLGSTGILICGASGAGKSELALALIHAGRLNGLYSALVADDQVLISVSAGRVIAETPPAIAGLIEIRGSGLAEIPYLGSAVMDFALMPVCSEEASRLPPEDSKLALAEGLDLPQLFLRWPAPDPFSKLAALCPGLGTGLPARPCHAGYQG